MAIGVTALELKNISKYYASQTAVVMGLSNVNLSFSTGEFVAVTGENGSGKSTLANVIGGMLPYEGGELYVMGQPTSHYNAADWERYRRDLISFISQDYGILPGNTVFENVESALILSGCERALAKKKTRDILAKVELSDHSKKRAAKLSSGQKQRLAIARALAKPSRILIADEPTGNLDRENSDKVIRLLAEASKERLVILITHEYAEAQDLVTRHVVLSDGKVVQDIDLFAASGRTAERVSGEAAEDTAGEPEDNIPGEAGTPERAEEQAPENEVPVKHAPGKRLAAYIAGLTAKAHPVFFFFTALILLLTCIASFVFIGNFIIATDDVPSRIYDNKAFLNGDPTRLVLAKDGREAFTDEEIARILDQDHVRSVEKYGYICDVNYYYREDGDYRLFTSTAYAADYHPVSNPDAWTYTVRVELLNDDQKNYMRSVTQAGEIRRGRTAEGFYEVVSSDPAVKAGTQVKVYIRNKVHWAVSQFIGLTFDVVGEASGSSGLYFSESFCRMMNSSVLAAIYNRGGTYFSGGDLGRYLVAPFDAEQYAEALIPRETDQGFAVPTELAENEFLIAPDPGGRGIEYGSSLTLNVAAWYTGAGSRIDMDQVYSAEYPLSCVGQFECSHPRFLLVNPGTFEKMTGGMASNQLSVFIDDYAYTQRVTDELVAMDYVALSPFTQGSTTKNETLEAERINLLRISLAAAVLTLVLQLILLKVTFSSLKEHYRLLSHMGLRGGTADASLAWLFLFLTIPAELIGAAVIWLLNRYGYVRVVNIFKYLEPPKLVLIFAVHLLFCVIAYFAAARTIRKQVFTVNGLREDIDGELMEEVMGA